MFAGKMVQGVIEEIMEEENDIGVKIRLDQPQIIGEKIYGYCYSWGRKPDDLGALDFVELLPDEPSYYTLIVTFGESICEINSVFENREMWGVSTLKEWIDNYEGTRFTCIGDCTAVITSEYNMEHVKEWLTMFTPIKECKALD